MPRTCTANGCNNPVFASDFCRFHQYKRRMVGGDLYNKRFKTRSPQRRTSIPKESKTRKEESKTYKEVKDEIRAELISIGKYNCFFCGKPMGEEKGFHHLKGRDGKNFIDKRYLVPGHNNCHVFKYHASSAEQLLRLPWYLDFLKRLKEIDISLYREELKKQDKAGISFEYNLDI